ERRRSAIQPLMFSASTAGARLQNCSRRFRAKSRMTLIAMCINHASTLESPRNRFPAFVSFTEAVLSQALRFMLIAHGYQYESKDFRPVELYNLVEIPNFRSRILHVRRKDF